MTGTEYGWAESGRGAAPHQQRIVVTPAARAEEAFAAYNAHLSGCPVCNERILSGSDFCDEGKQLGDAYVTAYERARDAASGEAS